MTGAAPRSDAQTGAAPRRRKVLRYLVNTGLSFVVNLGLTFVLHETFAVREAVAYAASLVTVFAMNFVLFRYYVFDGRTGTPGRQLAAFFATSVAFRSFEWLAFVALYHRLALHYLLVIVGVQGFTFVLKYIVYGGWLFKRSPAA